MLPNLLGEFQDLLPQLLLALAKSSQLASKHFRVFVLLCQSGTLRTLCICDHPIPFTLRIYPGRLKVFGFCFNLANH